MNNTMLIINNQNAMYSAQLARDQEELAKLNCKIFMPSFKHEGATVDSIQEYGQCVQMLYPKELTGADAIALKIIIVCGFLGLALGIWRGDDIVEKALLGVCFCFMGAIVPLIVGGLLYAVYYLFAG